MRSPLKVSGFEVDDLQPGSSCGTGRFARATSTRGGSEGGLGGGRRFREGRGGGTEVYQMRAAPVDIPRMGKGVAETTQALLPARRRVARRLRSPAPYLKRYRLARAIQSAAPSAAI